MNIARCLKYIWPFIKIIREKINYSYNFSIGCWFFIILPRKMSDILQEIIFEIAVLSFSHLNYVLFHASRHLSSNNQLQDRFRFWIPDIQPVTCIWKEKRIWIAEFSSPDQIRIIMDNICHKVLCAINGTNETTSELRFTSKKLKN